MAASIEHGQRRANVGKYGVADMVMLSDVSEAGILDNLDRRLQNGDMYTYIGHVLISSNPYRLIDGLYGRQQIQKYQGKWVYEEEPHVYAVAEQAYKRMLFERENQSIIISGESGAGKTENSKRIMEYISAVSKSGAQRVDYVKNIFLGSNPLLEAFGNAKTVRNDNSSRFGKYMVMQFNRAGEPIGGHVRNYLLEKNRVVQQTAGERSFHVFYQLLAGASRAEIQALGLAPPEDFEYLKHGDQDVAGVDDARECAETKKAMELVQISASDQTSIWQVVAAVLHIGNVAFASKPDGKDEASVVSNPDRVATVARLLSVDSDALQRCLTTRTVRTAATRSSSYQVPLSKSQAEFSRDALAKSLYGRLFDWLVQYINRSIQMDESGFVIGVLDIYGFEIFGQNSFEQLCINYVNEKLQQIFIELTLKSEQEEYRREGIAWEPVAYFNNLPCVELIDKHPMGIFSLLNEESLLATGTDLSFREKIIRHLSSNPHLLERTTDEVARGGSLGSSSSAGALRSPTSSSSPSPSPRSASAPGSLTFLVRHYAGTVEYSSAGWLEKNKDDLFNDIKMTMAQSSNAFVAALFPEISQDSKARPPPLAKQFKTQVADLMTELYSCQPSYIRCIKPNANKRPLYTDHELTRHQVRYLGLLENIRVRRAGYAYRQEFDKFMHRYKLLTKETWPHWPGTVNDGIRHILGHYNVEAKYYQFGKTKVFIRNPEIVTELEEQRLRRLDDIAVLIQKTWRAYLARKYLMEMKEKSMQIYEGKKERRRASIRPSFLGDQLQLAKDARVETIVLRSGSNKVTFSEQVGKVNRSLKSDPRVLMMTDLAIFLLPNSPKSRKLKRTVNIRDIAAVVMSPYCDGYVILRVANGDWILTMLRKTEFITILKDAFVKIMGAPLQISYSDSASIVLPGKKKSTITFVRNPATSAVTAAKAKAGLQINVGSADTAKDEDFAPVIAFASRHQRQPARSGAASSSQAASSSAPAHSSQFAALRDRFQ